MSIPVPSAGGSVYEWAVRLVAWLRANAITPGDGLSFARTVGGTTLRADIPCSRIVYLGGRKHDMRATTARWIVVDVLSNTVTATDTDPPDPFPDSVEYYDTLATHGDIHVPRFK